MKRIWLILSIIGFILPNIWVLQESLETGNILLWARPMETMASMFANRISSIFALDLLFGVMVFFIWSAGETPKAHRKSLLLIWATTLLFGFAGGLPLYLYWREDRDA